MLWSLTRGLIALFVLTVPADSAPVAELPAGAVVDGQAVDVRGGILPGADVSLREVVTNKSWQQIALDGNFRFEGLPPGRYELRVSTAGFAPRTLPPIELSAGQHVTLSAELQLQFNEATETVAIIAGESQDGVAQIATHLDFKQLAELPVGGRNFTQAATVQPGSCRSPPVSRRTAAYAAKGRRSRRTGSAPSPTTT
jgi:hypothetical protein